MYIFYIIKFFGYNIKKNLSMQSPLNSGYCIFMRTDSDLNKFWELNIQSRF